MEQRILQEPYTLLTSKIQNTQKTPTPTTQKAQIVTVSGSGNVRCANKIRYRFFSKISNNPRNKVDGSVYVGIPPR